MRKLHNAFSIVSGTKIDTIRYDTIKKFNVDSKAECDQLNLAHETKTNKKPSCR